MDTDRNEKRPTVGDEDQTITAPTPPQGRDSTKDADCDPRNEADRGARRRDGHPIRTVAP